MTATEMILEFKLASDNLDSSTIPDLRPEHILYYLNEAQLRFVKTRYQGNNLYKTSFEQVQKRTDDLNNIKRSYYVESVVNNSNLNIYELDLNNLFDEKSIQPSLDKYMFYVRGLVNVSSNKCPSRFVGINLIQTDDINSALIDPFNKPSITEPLAYFENGKLYVIADDTFTINQGKITCLVYPKNINNLVSLGSLQDCELSEQTHKEIVALAVQLALGDVKPEKLEVKMVQNQTIE